MSLRTHRPALLTLALTATVLAACSGIGSPPATTASNPASEAGGSPGFRDRMASMVFGPPAKPGEGKVEAAGPTDCPYLTVRQGAATVTIYSSGEQTPTNVRYQAKVGLQGRVILGPAGVPGRLEVPVRFALVREGPEPKTIWTQMYRVPVDIPAGQTNVPFVHIDDKISFPNPSAREIDAYIFYVGFDQQGVRDQPRGRRSPPRR